MVDSNKIQQQLGELFQKTIDFGNWGGGKTPMGSGVSAVQKQFLPALLSQNNQYLQRPAARSQATNGVSQAGAAPAAPQAPAVPAAPKLDARVAFKGLLSQYGFNASQTESLLNQINGWSNQGYDFDTIGTSLIQTSEAYKQRFVANGARIKAGKGALSPAEYIAQENAYRSALQYYNMPPGFYDQQSDFANWISNDVSPQEITDRAKQASALASTSDSEAIRQLKEYYGVNKGDIAAYFLDRDNALAVLEKRVAAIQLGGEALRQGLDIGRGYAEKLTSIGFNQDNTRGVFNEVAQTKADYTKLAQIDDKTLTTKQLIDAGLNLDSKASNQLKSSVRNEQARFSGTNAGNETFNRNTSGSY